MRVVRRLVHVLVIVLALVVGATAAAIIVSQTAWFKNWLRGYIVQESARYLNGQLTIERLGGNLFFGVEMENVGVSMDGTEVVAIEDLGLDYNVFQMIARGMSIDDIRLNRPVVYLKREGEAWSIARLIKKQEQEADREGPASPITIEKIEVTDASVVLDGPVGTSGVDVPNRFDRIDAKLSFRYEPVHYSVEISQVTFRGSEPSIALNELSGHVSVRDDTIFLENVALRTEESALRVEGSIEQYLVKPVFKLEAVVRQAVAAGDRPRRAGAGRRAAAAGVRGQGQRPDGSAGRRDERALVGWHPYRAADGGRDDAGPVRCRRRGRPQPRPRADPEGPSTENRCDRPCERRHHRGGFRKGRHHQRQRHARRATGDGGRLHSGARGRERRFEPGPRRDQRKGFGVRRGGDRQGPRDDPVRSRAPRLRPARGRAQRRPAAAAALPEVPPAETNVNAAYHVVGTQAMEP